MSNDLSPEKRAELPATAVHATIKRKHKYGVFVRIKVMDSKGDSYYFDAACFDFELKPWVETS